jgi:HAD superfamily hydrolase (TIGR01509 family)
MGGAVFPATLFDYNGVLVDDELVHLEAFRQVLEPLGVSVSEADYWDKYLGYDDAGAFRAILKDAGRAPSAEEVAELIEAKRPVYLERARAGLRFFAGAAEIVRSRAAQGPVGIVSGALESEIELGLDVLGVREHIQFIVSAEKAPSSKPDPMGYLLGKQLIAEAAGESAADRALVVEDSIAGVEAARGARLVCAAVAHSYPQDELRAAGADLVTANLLALTDELLEELYRRLYA